MKPCEPVLNDCFDALLRARQQNLLRPLDYQFARFICEQDSAADQHLALLAAFTSYQLGRGDVCLPLERIASLVDEWPKGLRKEFRLLFNALESDCLRPPSVGAEAAPVTDDMPVTLDMFAEPPAPTVPAGAVPTVALSDRYSSMGEPGEEAPLIFDGERLYLQRYFSFEAYLNSQITRLAQPLTVDESSLKQGLAQLFTADPAQPVDWQQVAVAVALRRRFSIISGGPGTGKTTTVTRLLALYVQQQCLQHGADFVPAIKLAAPTGKAAARLSESIAQARDQLNIAPEIIQRIPVEATTIHRLLGTIPNSKSFRHNAENPLHLELLVVDEASMIDLPMMARLLAALPPQGRIILIGDKHQLASVEAGSVLGDICAWHLQAGGSQSVTSAELQYSTDQAGYLSRVCGLDAGSVAGGQRAVADSLALLRHSYRFDAASGIGQLAAAINGGDATQIEPVLKKGYEDIDFIPLSSDSYPQLIEAAAQGYSDYLRALRAGAAPLAVLNAFARVQLLAVLRQGVYGVEGLNQALEQRLNRMGLIQTGQQWYPGRPVMIVQNDHQLGLYNGDIGIVQPDEDGRVRVWFEDPHHPDGVRGVLPSRLPGHETVFAMTVHKSQGSEFARVLMILPPEDGPLMTRELVYTGVTRAKQRLELYARLTSLKGATARRTERASGLGPKLWT
ncbi:exodeoxyribonuclease V subunit alpha [Aliamphritea hakodatensis]|uniref:exodeoxyribonuclease V subunit alpha n=1 Tax=Aliamphritea hakodatensis TaxID=2895352 RepID=UPI0022FD4C19|nr:exodeoxyribonuclease V subunit alpha [Aliamphritea hakodatensis]